MRKRRNRNGRSVIMFLALCLAVVAGFYYFLHSSVFFIEDIEVTGNHIVPTQDIIALSGIHTGQNIFEFKTEASQKAVEVIPYVRQAVIKRIFPNRVQISVVERESWAYVIHDGGVLVIDNEGVCLDKLEMMGETDLLVVSIAGMEDTVVEGQKVNENAIELIRFLSDALPDDLMQEVSEFHYSAPGQVIVFTLDGTEVRLGDRERLDEKISYWRRVIKKQKEEDDHSGLEYIDLRFKGQPVIQEKR
ncbi:MAG: FtsQ-type POTRA domain-containing protein [Syntrophomonadaceae bacterium]|nr:FtsQ-type POTRA domain-containing protein [Syntrophomonadaceae bacterium]